jgi:hypothetical protein
MFKKMHVLQKIYYKKIHLKKYIVNQLSNAFKI